MIQVQYLHGLTVALLYPLPEPLGPIVGKDFGPVRLRVGLQFFQELLVAPHMTHLQRGQHFFTARLHRYFFSAHLFCGLLLRSLAIMLTDPLDLFGAQVYPQQLPKHFRRLLKDITLRQKT